MCLQLIFWSCLSFILYTYIGYPIILFILSKINPKPVRKKDFSTWPSVTVVIAAKNEEKNIGARLENLLSQTYQGTFEVIIVSDGSTDKTAEIVQSFKKEFADRGRSLHLIEYFPSRGKPTALNTGVSAAKGEIIIFGDSRQRFSQQAVMELVKNFHFGHIGGVSGELIFVESHDSEIQVEMGTYWEYEKAIRKLESMTGSVIGATGAIYAIRKRLFKPLPPETLLDDVLIPMNIVLQGYRVVFDGTARAYDVVSKDIGSEWRRKVRTLAGNWQLLSIAPCLFIPFCSRSWWKFMSHKICRLLVPFILPLLLVTSFMAEGLFYKVFALLQAGFYMVVLISSKLTFLQKIPLVKIGYFFCVLNLAAMAGFFYWITGNSTRTWKKDTVTG